MLELTCKICGKTFLGRNSNCKYCSDNCRKIAKNILNEKNKEHIQEYGKKYRELHKEKAREYSKKYRTEHKEELRQKQKEYEQKNKDKISEYRRKNRHKFPSSSPNITDNITEIT